MYISPSQFSIVKGEKFRAKFKHYSLFYRKNKVVSNLQLISVIFAMAATTIVAGIAYEHGYLEPRGISTDLILIGCYFLGFMVWATLYLLILNKVEYPRYLVFVKEIKTNERN